MGVTLLVMTDGRADCLIASVASLHNLLGDFDTAVIHDDSGDRDYSAWLTETFPAFTVVTTPGRSGFAGAYRSAWSYLRNNCTSQWVFSTEDDFLIQRPVDVSAMARVMSARPLAQMALRRQPWNPQEIAAGGIVEQHPEDYSDHTDGTHEWLEHRRFFTTNPHLTRLSFIESHDWPTGDQSEGRFGVDLFTREPLTRCGFWGPRTDPPLVEHIGHTRAGTGY